MAIVKKVVGALLLLIVVLLAIGFVLPSKYKVERSQEIAAPPEKVFSYLDDPRAWARWTAWNQRDPTMKITYGGPDKGQGAKWSRESKTEGNGSMEFIRAESPRVLEYKLSFPDFDMTSTGKLELTSGSASTKVTWTNEGDVGGNPLMHYFAVLMDRMVGPDFEAGLKNLKTQAEKS